MKINFIYKKKNYGNFIKFFFDYHQNLFEKKNNNFFFTEDLENTSIEELNNCDLIYARQDLNKKIINRLKVPIVIYHEKLFLENHIGFTRKKYSLDHLLNKKNIFFLTDKIYENKNKKIFSCSYLFKPNKKLRNFDNKKKDIDILYISGHSKFTQNKLIKNFINLNINNFGNILQNSSEFYLKNKNFFLRKFQKLFYNSNHSFKYFFNNSLNSLRYLRKQKILKELLYLSKNYRVVYFGDNSNDLVKLPCSGFLESNKILETFQRSKVVICTTPCHNSFINERVQLALDCLAIPILEKYPQNIELNVPKQFFYDYENLALSKIIPPILKNYNDTYLEYMQFIKNINFEKYSLKKSLEKILEYSKKKSL